MGDYERRHGAQTRRIDDRVDSLEKTVDQIAPVAVHLAEMNVRFAQVQQQQADLRADLNSWIERMDKRLDPLHARLRKVEYAVIAIGLAAISPKIGGPDVSHVVSTVIQTWL